jgi:phosphohistidine phosphatase SixA
MTRLFFLAILLGGTLTAQALSGGALVKTLQQGGFVVVMRHASSPNAVPAGASERQLDEAGRTAAAAMGKALRDLQIPIGEVYSSPTQRAMETARLLQVAQAKPAPELGDNGQSMSGGTAGQADWLQKRVAQSPKGTNTLLITHMPNLRAAFPAHSNVADGEALIFGPGSTLVARVKMEDWGK